MMPTLLNVKADIESFDWDNTDTETFEQGMLSCNEIDYYGSAWEHEADVYGGVERNGVKLWPDEYSDFWKIANPFD